jgi:hypothetical protein
MSLDEIPNIDWYIEFDNRLKAIAWQEDDAPLHSTTKDHHYLAILCATKLVSMSLQNLTSLTS